jgi:hypothetical protein
LPTVRDHLVGTAEARRTFSDARTVVVQMAAEQKKNADRNRT